MKNGDLELRSGGRGPGNGKYSSEETPRIGRFLLNRLKKILAADSPIWSDPGGVVGNEEI